MDGMREVEKSKEILDEASRMKLIGFSTCRLSHTIDQHRSAEPNITILYGRDINVGIYSCYGLRRADFDNHQVPISPALHNRP